MHTEFDAHNRSHKQMQNNLNEWNKKKKIEKPKFCLETQIIVWGSLLFDRIRGSTVCVCGPVFGGSQTGIFSMVHNFARERVFSTRTHHKLYSQFEQFYSRFSFVQCRTIFPLGCARSLGQFPCFVFLGLAGQTEPSNSNAIGNILWIILLSPLLVFANFFLDVGFACIKCSQLFAPRPQRRLNYFVHQQFRNSWQ